MHTQVIATYEEIDWRLLRANARSRKSWQSKGAKEWDRTAGSFAQRTTTSLYAASFLAHLKVHKDMSVLDIGCGPGTLAVPLATRVRKVTALDYSETMLEHLQSRAKEQGITNIRPLLCAWEDDWQARAVGRHDIVIASRSMNIDDLEAGIIKLNSHAIQQVYIADRIDPTPFDPDAFAAIGRPFNAGPDYIYTINALYRLNIHPKVTHIELSDKLRFPDLHAAFAAYSWMFKELTPAEEEKLTRFLAARIIREEEDSIIIKRRYPQRWALISWCAQMYPESRTKRWARPGADRQGR